MTTFHLKEESWTGKSGRVVCWLQLQVEPGDFGSILSLFWEQDERGQEPCPFTGVPGPCASRTELCQMQGARN